MRQVRQVFRSLFHSPSAIPSSYRRNFFLLYSDVFFWGILNGSILTFLSVYTARLGATGEQVGLIGAVPALVTLVMALPSGKWLERQPVHGSVVWTSIASRWFYLLLIPLPFLFSEQIRIWAIIAITLVMTIPGTATTIGFQSLFAEVVPVEWRAHSAGIRNAVFAIVSTATILICGQILGSMRFPEGYPIVFTMGAVGALMSSISLKLIKLPENNSIEKRKIIDSPSSTRKDLSGLKMVRIDIIRGKFGLVVGLLFLFHLAQFLPIPLFPLFSVNYLKFSDQFISLGSGVFNLAVFLGSTQLEKVSKRFGNHGVVGYGIVFLAFYPGLLALTRELGLYLFTNMIGGLAWSMVGGAIFNYILENVPSHDRPAHIALYTFALNGAILLGSIIGPSIAGQIGYVDALLVFAFLRLLSGLAILSGVNPWLTVNS